LTLKIYKLTRSFSKDEQYGLTSQIRRAAGSVPSTIVEGYHRRGIPDKLRFFNMAHASLEEVRYQLILSQDLGYADTNPFQSLATEVSKLINSYTAAI